MCGCNGGNWNVNRIAPTAYPQYTLPSVKQNYPYPYAPSSSNGGHAQKLIEALRNASTTPKSAK